MTAANAFEMIAWIVSAIIACWLLVDVARVSRNYDEELLVNPGEPMADMPAETADVKGAVRHERR